MSCVLRFQRIVRALHIPMAEQPTESSSCFTGHVGTSLTDILEFLFRLYKTSETVIVLFQLFKELFLNAENVDDNIGQIEEQNVLPTTQYY